MNRVGLLLIVLMVGCSSLQSPASTAAYVAQHYTAPDPDVDGQRTATNRFSNLSGARVTELLRPECWAFSLEGGLYCFHAVDGQPNRAVLFRQQEPPTAILLAASAFGDAFTSMQDRLVFLSLVNADSGDVPPAVDLGGSGGAINDRQFASGVACSIKGETMSLPWQPAVVDYIGEVLLDIWDVFSLGATTYLLIASTGCAGECRALEVYAVDGGSVRHHTTAWRWAL